MGSQIHNLLGLSVFSIIVLLLCTQSCSVAAAKKANCQVVNELANNPSRCFVFDDGHNTNNELDCCRIAETQADVPKELENYVELIGNAIDITYPAHLKEQILIPLLSPYKNLIEFEVFTQCAQNSFFMRLEEGDNLAKVKWNSSTMVLNETEEEAKLREFGDGFGGYYLPLRLMYPELTGYNRRKRFNATILVGPPHEAQLTFTTKKRFPQAVEVEIDLQKQIGEYARNNCSMRLSFGADYRLLVP